MIDIEELEQKLDTSAVEVRPEPHLTVRNKDSKKMLPLPSLKNMVLISLLRKEPSLGIVCLSRS